MSRSVNTPAKTPFSSTTTRQPILADAIALELPEKTCSDEDDARGQFHPSEVTPVASVEPSDDAAELRQERMPTLHSIANDPDARLGLSSARGSHAEALVLGPLPSGAVAVGPIGLDRRHVARVGMAYQTFGQRRPDYQCLEHIGRLLPVIGRRPGHGGAKRHSMLVGRQVNGRPALGSVHRRWTSSRPPFGALCLEPSNSTLSQLIPRNRSYFSANACHAVRKQSSSSHRLSRCWMVLPQGKQDGTISQPMPLTSTYSSPCRTLRLSQGGRPLPHQTTGGRTGSNVLQISSGSCREMSLSFIGQASMPVLFYRLIRCYLHEVFSGSSKHGGEGRL